MEAKPIVVVVIGRNEGERLRRCLRSVAGELPTAYVDSGSTDDSVAFARGMGVTVLPLDMRIGFTAARARNVGWRHLVDEVENVAFIQFVDGDCELDPDWLDKALSAMRAEPGLAAVFGRRRERFPEQSIYNRMCDDEWNVPVGIVAACGGDALFRVEALVAADGYSDDLIAGEEPDLCLRLRRLGWKIRRIDAEMTLHDANILSFGSWWKRTKRAGFAYAAHVLRHGAGSDPQWRRQVNSILLWGLVWPLGGIVLAALLSFVNLAAGAAMLGAVVGSYALQVVRIAMRKRAAGEDRAFAFRYAALIMTGKFAEMTGVLRCWTSHALKRGDTLIEYKRPT
ncbi:MAG: glycosyltransferase [Sphingomonadales bacterium]|nr:glycosyltransferase [Sphingomonadales bacterium]